ncbi:putative nucleotidyltransferase, Ribonuclease H [Helianthus annuus]|nr:putative nucleotidyltransferase, Ribonuclease H [Helianthus annuus]
MPHTRSQGPPEFFASSEPERELFERLSQHQKRISRITDKKVLIPIPFPTVAMGDNPARRTVNQHATEGFTGGRTSITTPEAPANQNWQIPSHIMTTISNSAQFHGLEDEDAPGHITRFLRICSTFNLHGVTADAVYLRLFPFSLSGRAATWLDTLPQNSITTWEILKSKFYKKYYPPSKAARLRDQIHSFRMDPDEPYYMAWERFQTLLSKCPQHGLSEWALVEKFYNGLTPDTQLMFNTAAGGCIMDKKDPTECEEMFESFAMAGQQSHPARNSIPSTRTTSSAKGVYQVTPDTSLAAELEALKREMREMKLKERKCEICRGGHETVDCPVRSQEEVDYISNPNNHFQNASFNNSYNSGWKNQSNWRSGGNPPGFQQQSSSGSSSGTEFKELKDILLAQSQQLNQYMTSNNQRHEEHDRMFKNQGASLQNLERQMGEMARQLQQRPQGGLPGNIVPNPNSHAHAKAVMTRSGRGATVDQPVVDEEPVDEEIEMETPTGKVQPRLAPASTAQSSESQKKKKEPIRDYSSIPFPGRFKREKEAEQFSRFLGLFKQLHINLPFVEALAQMPKYAKFLKDILSNKKKLEELSHVSLSEECSAVLQNRLPKKMTDPGSFTIPCLIGDLSVSNALADLGASINLMPYAVFAKLNLGEPSPTRMSLQLADRSVKYPRGIVENMLVKVDKFVFPVDFVILDMDEDAHVPLILGRPFLATARALIDVYDGKLTLRVEDDMVTFDINRSMTHPREHDDTLYFVDTIMSHVGHCLSKVCGRDASDTQILDTFIPEVEMTTTSYGESESHSEVFEVVERKEPEERPSVESPPSLELKDLPSHLEYAFLDDGSQLPVIISSELTEEEKTKLMGVLKAHKQAIAWKLVDIKGINPSFCTHKILMEDEFKPVVQPQRRLNPNMQDVVKKEVIKLLDAGLIYPISDSAWVSPVQVVPKKGGMTVVPNERNELIPTRTVTGWRVCIDYRRLNDATRKDHFPLPFIDQMLERLSGQQFYCFLDGFSGYFQIPIAPEDQEKTTFTCPYGTFAYRRMPFGLCNAPATFQRCMVAIFHDMIEDSMEVFMDDFSVFRSSFDQCLRNLDRMLARCEETNLMLNWEKCHFMVKEGIVLGHKISRAGIEVDRAKIDAISRLPPPTSVKSVRSFLGHAGFYRRFIRDFSKIARPMTRLLEKDVPFDFSEECVRAFEFLKEKLVSAPILIAPDWSLPFEIMCDASDFAVGAILGQRREKRFHPIYYASKTLNDAQEHYTTTEKELLAVVFALDKFRSYLVLSKVVVYTDHAALRHLFAKKDAKPRLIRWILLLQEFDLEIRDKKGAENVAADHLSRLENLESDESDEDEIGDSFPHETLMFVKPEDEGMLWYADIVNYLKEKVIQPEMSFHQRRKLIADSKYYFWDDPHLFRVGVDQVVRRCIAGEERMQVLRHCHEGPTGGHYGASYTARKVLDSGFYWPTVFRDAHELVRSCDACQRVGNISSRNEMPQNPMQVVEVFDIWGIDFMGPFPMSRGNRYILVAIDYVSKWVEA